MLREWPFTARFVAWQSRWANAEPRRLLVHATEAFIDRAPIDWAALLARTRTESGRAIVQSLRSLDNVRNTVRQDPNSKSRLTQRIPTPGEMSPGDRCWPLTSFLVRLLVVLAATQVVCSFLVLAVAFANGETISNRTPQIILALAFAAASLFLGTAKSRDRRSLYLLGFFACTASVFTRGALTGVTDSSPGLTAVVLNGPFPNAFASAYLWQFALDFPRVQRFTSFDVFARRAAIGAWLLGGLLFGVNVISAYYPIHAEPLAYLLCTHPSKTFTYLWPLMLIPPVVVIFVRSRRALPAERRKVARLALVIAAGPGPLLLLSLARLVWPGVDLWLLTTGFDRIWLDALIVGGLAAMPILATAVIMVDRPLELQSILRRASRYALARSVLTMLIVAPFVVLFVMLYGLRHVAIADLFAGPRAWLLLSCSVVGCLLLLVRSRLLDTVDRRLSHRAADHQELLARSLERVRFARGSREIIAAVARELRESIGAETVHVLLPATKDAFVDPFAENRRLPRDGAIVAMLQQLDMPVDLSSNGPLLSLLPKDDRDWVAANEVELAVALTQRDGALGAITLVGAKRSGLPFDERDRWFVSSLITAAAAAWDSDRHAQPLGAAAGRPSDPDEAALECPRCGVVVDAGPFPCSCRAGMALASLPHHVRERFVVQRRLGAGGMGVVYLARDTALDRDVALKTLPGLRKHSAAGLRGEARAMAALSHESLAVVYDLKGWRDTPVLVVEYLPNGTLARRLINGPLSRADALQIGLALTRALTYVHAKGLLHRDLKPSNIGFTATGVPKLLDFGLATLMTPSNDVHREPGANTLLGAKPPLAGTRAYLPPEAYEGAAATAAFDLWALSVVMLEAMTGLNPFAAAGQIRPSTRRGNSTSVDLHPYLRDLTPALRRFFERALARRPHRRFQTGPDLHAALEDAARSA